MSFEWTVTHLNDGTMDYIHKSGDGCKQAWIHGKDKEWTYFASIYPKSRISELVHEIKGSAISVDSAKEDIRRWFTEADRE